MEVLYTVGAAAFAVLLVYVLVKLLAKPMKGILKFLLHAAVGILMLFGVNLIGGFFNFYIPLTWKTVLVTGVGGIPGVALVVLYYLLW